MLLTLFIISCFLCCASDASILLNGITIPNASSNHNNNNNFHQSLIDRSTDAGSSLGYSNSHFLLPPSLVSLDMLRNDRLLLDSAYEGAKEEIQDLEPSESKGAEDVPEIDEAAENRLLHGLQDFQDAVVDVVQQVKDQISTTVPAIAKTLSKSVKTPEKAQLEQATETESEMLSGLKIRSDRSVSGSSSNPAVERKQQQVQHKPAQSNPVGERSVGPALEVANLIFDNVEKMVARPLPPPRNRIIIVGNGPALRNAHIKRNSNGLVEAVQDIVSGSGLNRNSKGLVGAVQDVVSGSGSNRNSNRLVEAVQDVVSGSGLNRGNVIIDLSLPGGSRRRSDSPMISKILNLN